MADPTEVSGPAAGHPSPPEQRGGRSVDGEPPRDGPLPGSPDLDPPGMPPPEGATEASGPLDPAAATPADEGEGWLEDPPPPAEPVMAPPQEGGTTLSEADRASAEHSPEPARVQSPTRVMDEAPPGGAPARFAPFVEDDEVAEAVEEGAPAWMMTFGDMMSLLLTFFILLFSMSSIEAEKFKAATESLADALGQSNAGIMPDGVVPIAPPPTSAGEVRDRIVEERMDDIASQLEEFVRENRLEDQVVVSKESHGVFLRMQNQALFGPGSADIAEQSVAIVEQLGTILDRMDLPVKVSGHTDNVPIRSAVFPSNWELSAARAAGVARILVSRGHDPASVGVEAFGEYRPVTNNDSEEGRAQNRRVELYFGRLSVEAALDQRGELPVGDQPDSEEGAEGAEGAEAPAS